MKVNGYKNDTERKKKLRSIDMKIRELDAKSRARGELISRAFIYTIVNMTNLNQMKNKLYM